jgi:integrase/recombinase XerD
MEALGMDVPLISIIVRHSDDCKQKGDRFFKRCECKKWLEYFRGGEQHRVAAKTRSWAIAEEVKRTLEEQFKTGKTAPAVALASAGRKTVKDKVALFITSKEGERVSIAVLRKYRYELPRFEAFLSKRSKFYPGDIKLDDLVEYRATWTTLSPITQQKMQERLRAFLKYACDPKDNLLELLKLKGIIIKAKDRPKPQPFTDAELNRLLAQVPVSFPDEPRRSRVTALIHLMVSTGLAIVDAVKLEKKDFEKGWLNIERQKTGRSVKQKLPSALLKELLTVTNGNPRFVFWNGEIKLSSLTGLFQANLRDVMKDAKVYTHGDLSHRFRDTYVKFLFDNGCTTTQVADAIGDTEAIVVKHYKEWIVDEDLLQKLPQRTFGAQA